MQQERAASHRRRKEQRVQERESEAVKKTRAMCPIKNQAYYMAAVGIRGARSIARTLERAKREQASERASERARVRERERERGRERERERKRERKRDLLFSHLATSERAKERNSKKTRVMRQIKALGGKKLVAAFFTKERVSKE